MHPDLILNFTFVIVMTAIIGAIINGLVRKTLDYKRAVHAAQQTGAPARIVDLEARTQFIEDRLRVLERIATDPEARGRHDLAQEIEELRLAQEKA